MKTLNTQLASWTQLRHDTLLYSKQSYAGPGPCLYPAGYVEPRLEFWHRLRQMALWTRERIRALDYRGEFSFPIIHHWLEGEPALPHETVRMAEIQDRQMAHLERFAETLAMLEGISRRELDQECLLPDQVLFLGDLIERISGLPAGCTGIPRYDGWYPQLFYRKRSDLSEAGFHYNRGAYGSPSLVADVHTDLPSAECASPGHVLHQGVGQVHLLLMAVDSGGDPMVVAGPVFSHYEFAIEGPPQRLSDAEWVGQVREAIPNPWTQGYLVAEWWW